MKALLPVLALLGAIAVPLSAQTTGVPTFNDLVVRVPPTYLALGSATTSCNFVGVCSGTTPYTIAYQYDALGSTAVTLALGMGGCTPALFPFTPTATPGCAGALAGSPLTNLWFSVNIVGPWPIFVPGILSTTGSSRWNFTIPGNPSQPIWAQAIALDTCSPTGFKFSQALGFQ